MRYINLLLLTYLLTFPHPPVLAYMWTFAAPAAGYPSPSVKRAPACLAADNHNNRCVWPLSALLPLYRCCYCCCGLLAAYERTTPSDSSAERAYNPASVGHQRAMRK